MSTVSVTVGRDRVGVVEFSNGENNYLDGELISSLATHCEALSTDGEARAILLCSAGKHFCAGADFAGGEGDFFAAGGPEHPYDAMVRLLGVDIPVVAAVQGAAIGGGLGLALTSDFRFASPKSRFSAPFAVLGMHQGSAISVTLPRVVGQQAAKDLMFTGRRIAGDEAYALGLVDRLHPGDELRAAAHAYAAQIAATAPLTLRSIRESLRGDLADRAHRATQHERAVQTKQRASLDHREGIAAAREGRAPNFVGR